MLCLCLFKQSQSVNLRSTWSTGGNCEVAAAIIVIIGITYVLKVEIAFFAPLADTFLIHTEAVRALAVPRVSFYSKRWTNSRSREWNFTFIWRFAKPTKNELSYEPLIVVEDHRSAEFLADYPFRLISRKEIITTLRDWLISKTFTLNRTNAARNDDSDHNSKLICRDLISDLNVVCCLLPICISHSHMFKAIRGPNFEPIFVVRLHAWHEIRERNTIQTITFWKKKKQTEL